MFDFLRRPVAAVAEAVRRAGFFSNAPVVPKRDPGGTLERWAEAAVAALPRGEGTFDSTDIASAKRAMLGSRGVLPPELLGFFERTGYPGPLVCAYLAQHWLINKACWMPARDAVRRGYKVVTDEGDELANDDARRIRRADERYKVARHLREFVGLGRVFGYRIALFKVDYPNPAEAYENPFNIDAVRPGTYRGIVQVDPNWCSPVLDTVNASRPDSLNYYEPTWWLIGGRKYHRSHLVIFRNGELPDVLKPQYQYGGIPVPQLIVERVYNAERTANEAPQLAMTKRTTTFATNTEAMMTDELAFMERLETWARFRDNYAVKILDKEADAINQFDTSLADLDAVIMSQYQLVAAAANVPATKLLGTTPKGFNATGEYEESSYHEELESIQTNDLLPLLRRHHELLARSEFPNLRFEAQFEPLDTPTAKEAAETEKIEADRDAVLVGLGAIDGWDVRERLRRDPRGAYLGIEAAERPDPAEPEEVDPNAEGAALDAWDGVRLVTNQRHLDPMVVAEKVAARDYDVQVSPILADSAGMPYRVILDGHHSLVAARMAGVEPRFVEADPTVGDYEVVTRGA